MEMNFKSVEILLREMDIPLFFTSDQVDIIDVGCNSVSTNETPILFTDWLQTCIGLIAQGTDFDFLAHVKTLNDVNVNSDSLINCKHVQDLYNAIKYNSANIEGPIKVTLTLGRNPLPEINPHRRALEEDIEWLIEKCRNDFEIEVVRQNNLQSHSVLAVRNGGIIWNRNEHLDLLRNDSLPSSYRRR